MLHARATDTKQRSGSAQRTASPRQEAPPHHAPPGVRAQYGNQAMLRAASGILQRQCTCGSGGPGGGTCEKCREEMIRRRAASATPAHATAAIPPAFRGLPLSCPGDRHEQEAESAANDVLASAAPVQPAVAGLAASESGVRPGGGQPLPAAARLFSEPRFGYDFSRVRIHTGPEAEEWTRLVNAEAFTVGSDVVFGEGRYQPGTSAGRALLAHELAHVVQQGGGNMQLARKTGSLLAATTILKKVVEVDIKSTGHLDWEFLTLLDKPGGAKVVTVKNETLLRAEKEIPAAEYSGASPGVFLFTVMKDCDHEQPGPDGKAQMGYADSIYVKASSCGLKPEPKDSADDKQAEAPKKAKPPLTTKGYHTNDCSDEQDQRLRRLSLSL